MNAEIQEKLEWLRELERMVKGAITHIEMDMIVTDPKSSAGNFDMILGRFGVVDLKKDVFDRGRSGMPI